MIRINLSLPFFAGFLLIMSQSCKKENDREVPLRNVILAQVETLSGEETVNYPGTVEEGASISAAFMADGKIAQVLVKEGDRVSKGQLLATLDDSDYRIGVAQLEAQFNQMTREKARMDAMYDKHNIAPNDYEKFSAGYEQLRLQLDMAKRQLGYTRLHSPTGGYIASRFMNPGELVGAGTPVFTIVDDTQLIASVDLPVSVYLDRSKIISAQGSVPGVAGEIPLSIISFTPDADNSMLYRMKLAVPASFARELTPGMNISVCLKSAEDTSRESIVPSRAVFTEDGKTYVWVYNSQDSTIHKKTVVIMGAPTGRMSVVAGLNKGEKIVETGVKQLYEGEKVNVLNREEAGI